GTSAVVLDRFGFGVIAEARVGYRDDPRFACLGLGAESPILPPGEPGEAHQPVAVFLAGLEAVLEDLPRAFLSRVAAIDLSAQQHGQVWLGAEGIKAISALARPGAGAPGMPSLASSLGPGLAWERSPIWMSSNTAAEASLLRRALGGAEAVTARSGSDVPLRFSGPVLIRSARRYPQAWGRTRRFHLISSFLSGVLAAKPDCPVDWGNGSGTGLMDWKRRAWDGELIAAAARGMGCPADRLASVLPALAHPLTIAGPIAAYFAERYGFDPACRVLVGSGDNPQTKVLASGCLLSLGTSFVLMAEGDRPHVSANAMYDGLGRPFVFGCRTNGALSWEAIRRRHGLEPGDYASSDRALAMSPPGADFRILQTESESFPVSPPLDLGACGDFAADYAGVVDASLCLLYLGSKPFAKAGGIAATGGGAGSQAVLSRIASIWRARVTPIANAGAATGAALAAALALRSEKGRRSVIEEARSAAAGARTPVEPDPALVRAYHRPGGFLARLEAKARSLGFSL
ncbi:MAG TPA: FGGY family carbohydrate kinase, partial [Rectinemataceae bacterium]|nr:FGGY family carbohydrate kinase [Rectinemataceae bacterium]